MIPKSRMPIIDFSQMELTPIEKLACTYCMFDEMQQTGTLPASAVQDSFFAAAQGLGFEGSVEEFIAMGKQVEQRMASIARDQWRQLWREHEPMIIGLARILARKDPIPARILAESIRRRKPEIPPSDANAIADIATFFANRSRAAEEN